MRMYDPKDGTDLWNIYTRRAGKTPIFTKPSELLQAFDDYVEWSRSNPIECEEYVKSGKEAGTPYVVRKKNLLTEAGFCFFIGANSNYVQDRSNAYAKDWEEFKDEIALGFLNIMNDIRKFIAEDMDRGAVSGQYDSMYVARLRGLKDQRDVTSGGEKVQGGLSVQVLTDEAAGNIRKLAKVSQKRSVKPNTTKR